MNKLFKFYWVLILLGFIIIIYWFYTQNNPNENYHDKTVDLHRTEEYFGKVIDRFIDKSEHGFKKVIIEKGGIQKIILFNTEHGGLFEFIQKGDTIYKKSGSLDVSLKRKHLDTVITMKFYSQK